MTDDQTRVHIAVRIEKTTVNTIDVLAEEEDRTRSSMIRRLLAEALDRRAME